MTYTVQDLYRFIIKISGNFINNYKPYLLRVEIQTSFDTTRIKKCIFLNQKPTFFVTLSLSFAGDKD